MLAFLPVYPHGIDDDILADKLGVPQRQAVNQVCRQLESQGLVERTRDPASGKLLNRLRQPTTVPTPSAAHRPEASSTAADTIVPLADQNAVHRFAYSGEIGISEDEVKRAVQDALMASGWEVEVRWGHDRGIDIEAHRGAERLVLEAKGEGSLQPMRVNYFIGPLGELLQRMDTPDASYGLALPAHRQFAGLVTRLPAWVRARLGLRFYFVRPGAQGYEIGLLVPHASDDEAP